MKIINAYSVYPLEYESIYNRLIVATFLRASHSDKAFAKELMLEYPLLKHPMTYIRGLGSLLLS